MRLSSIFRTMIDEICLDVVGVESFNMVACGFLIFRSDGEGLSMAFGPQFKRFNNSLRRGSKRFSSRRARPSSVLSNPDVNQVGLEEQQQWERLRNALVFQLCILIIHYAVGQFVMQLVYAPDVLSLTFWVLLSL